MNSDAQVIFVITLKRQRIDLREAGLDLAGLPWLYSGAKCVVAGARRDGRLLALAVVHQDRDLEEALEDCLDALEYEGAEAAVAYSPLHGPGTPGSGTVERNALFGIGRCMASDWAIHLVDWLLCGGGAYHCLKPFPADPCDWWDVPEVRPAPPPMH